MKGFVELARRAGLAAGLAVFLWQFFATPPVLVQVKRADFAGEYERRYKRRDLPLGVMERGMNLLRRMTDPGSLEGFIATQTENRLIEAAGPRWSGLYRSLPEGGVWYAPDQPPVAALMPEIETVFRRAQWTVLYAAAPGGYLEFRYQTRPKESKAPTALIYPSRNASWPWLAGALAIYCLLPWPRRGAGLVVFDRLPLVVLDGLAALFGGGLFTIPLYAAHTTEELLREDLGFAVTLWCLAGLFAVLMLWTARRAAYRVRVARTGIRVEGMAGAAEFGYGDLKGAGYALLDGIRTGIFLRRRDGARAVLDWANLLGFETVLEALRAARVAQLPDEEA